MISQEKWKILTPLQKLPKNVEDLGKLIVAKGFKKLPNLVTLTVKRCPHNFQHWLEQLLPTYMDR